MHLTAHLIFNGNCREAFEFYASLFGGKVVTMMIWGESPLATHVSEADRNAVMHARVEFGHQTLAGADIVNQPYEPIRGAFLLLEPPSIQEAERIFAALTEGGKIEMPLEETFWAGRYGRVIDRFGVPWELNCDKPH
jgi:PhnB protein